MSRGEQRDQIAYRGGRAFPFGLLGNPRVMTSPRVIAGKIPKRRRRRRRRRRRKKRVKKVKSNFTQKRRKRYARDDRVI